MNPVLIVLTVGLILYAIYSFVTGKPENSPPGPWRLPIWGSYWLLLCGNYKFPHKNVSSYMKKYQSKIIGCYLGDAFAVIVNDYDSVKEVLTRKEFDGRLTENIIIRSRGFGKQLGIFFNDGLEWQEQRRYSLRNLRDFGFGRRFQHLEKELAEELSIMISTIKDGPINDAEKKIVANDVVLFPDILFPSCANAIWTVMSGERLDRAEHELLYEFCDGAHRFQRGGDTTGGALTMTVWLKHFGNLFGWRDFNDGNQMMINFIKRYMNKITDAELLDRTQDGFIQTYLRKIKELNGKNVTFSEEQLIMIVVDFVFPALSAVPSVITHAIKYMMHYPNEMKRVQKEIDDIVGRERLPVWDDRKDLSYTEAALREVMRMETLTPWSVAHRCTETTTLQNYTIPTDTIMITNLSAMHMDPAVWGDPNTFRPDRFLTADQSQLGKDWSLPFGFGRRVCAGETFARWVVFELFATLVQHFDFKYVKGQPTGLDDKIPGIIVQPVKTWIQLIPRI